MPTQQKIKKPLVWIYPKGIEREYQRILSKEVTKWENLARKMVIPFIPDIVDKANREKNPISTNVKSDANDPAEPTWEEDTDSMIQEYAAAISALLLLLIRPIKKIVNLINPFNLKQWRKIVTHSLGIRLLIKEPWLNPMIDSFVSGNVALITKLQGDTIADIKNIIIRGVNQGKTAKDIEREILAGTNLEKGRFKKTRTRARLIARDQVNKLNGQLQMQRQTDLGITKFMWITERDEKVRKTHSPLDSKTCSWEDSTIYFQGGRKRSRDGIGATFAQPGQDINCRCSGSPIFSSIKDLDSLI